MTFSTLALRARHLRTRRAAGTTPRPNTLPSRALRARIRRICAEQAHLGTPDGASANCAWAAEYVAERIPGSEVIHLLGARVPYPRRHAEWAHYPVRDPCFYHMVVRVGAWYIDLTARQLDPDALYPLFRTKSAMKRYWIQMSSQDLL